MAEDVLVKGEQMWFSIFDPITGTYKDPTNGKDHFIPQAVFDHGGYMVYDITAPNAIMPVTDREVKNG